MNKQGNYGVLKPSLEIGNDLFSIVITLGVATNNLIKKYVFRCDLKFGWA